jgi:hypothetical protein
VFLTHGYFNHNHIRAAPQVAFLYPWQLPSAEQLRRSNFREDIGAQDVVSVHLDLNLACTASITQTRIVLPCVAAAILILRSKVGENARMFKLVSSFGMIHAYHIWWGGVNGTKQTVRPKFLPGWGGSGVAFW